MPPRTRRPQLTLPLDVAPAPADACRWRDGGCLPYLGGALTLRLDTDRRQAVLEDAVLHLPLPPDAGERQIRDAAEAWLRRAAARRFTGLAAQLASRGGCPAPAVALSFSTRGSWVEVDGDAEPQRLRCCWRLIEQPPDVIEQTLAGALLRLPRPVVGPDLFALA